VPADTSTQREQDLADARELRARLDRTAAPEWIAMRSLRACFGGHRLTRVRKREIARVLTAVGIDVYPQLQELSTRDKVRLEVVESFHLAPEEPLRSLWRRLRARVFSPISGAITLAASIVALLTWVLAGDTATHSPHFTRMSGDLNVAIAPFTDHGRTTSEGIALAQAIAGSLHRQLPPLDRSLDIKIRGPDEAWSLQDAEVADARTAPTLARMVGADIMVYGDLEVTLQMTRLTPVFYLNTEKLPSASALSGRYGYGQAISMPYSIDASPQARAAIRDALIQRTNAYAAAFVGIGAYLTHSLKSANRYLLNALHSSPSEASLPLLNLLLGNVADQRGDPMTAVRYYTVASHSQATHARAEFGLAEATYRMSSYQCRAGRAQRAGLLNARAMFGHVLRGVTGTEVQSTDPPLRAKVYFGLGQVDLCLSASHTENAWWRARQEFETVIHAYQPDLPDLRDDVAEAYAGVGLCDLTIEGTPKSYIEARVEYKAAAETTTIRSRRAYFEGVVGFAEESLGHYAAATHEYRRAAQLAVGSQATKIYLRKAERVAHLR
jgi:hypothetical protein